MPAALTKEVVARLRAARAKINRIWIPPVDNRAGMFNIVTGTHPVIITITIDEKIGEMGVLRYINARDQYFYPPRRSIDDLMADYRAAVKGELYAE